MSGFGYMAHRQKMLHTLDLHAIGTYVKSDM